ncbi:peptidase inhibitor family I36 protein [Actinoallomurus sp. CA-142502]|uniref:peptidase inhibitor family I36 protein n=1 Tax=Actinoallomurus sp. CA-142502 TaxID=3239885 RepID=UPI003D8D78D3
MSHRLKSLGAKLAGVASLAVAVPLVAAVPAHADTSCGSGLFCIWVNEQYGGTAYRPVGNDPQWSDTSNPAYAVWDADSSWKNRYQSWYWACVYDLKGYQNVTVWVSQGQSIPAVPSNMWANRGASNQGLYSGDTC